MLQRRLPYHFFKRRRDLIKLGFSLEHTSSRETTNTLPKTIRYYQHLPGTHMNRAPPPGTVVCRQYIYDRVSGNSYIPPSQRQQPTGSEEEAVRAALELQQQQQEDGTKKSSKNPFNDNKEDKNKSPNESDDDDDDDQLLEDGDPTDCRHRPPHFLCYVPPCVRRCPGFVEQNACCECVGQIGCQFFKKNHVARRRVFAVGFCFNFAALAFTIVASMAFTTNFNLLTSTSFTRGDITVPAWNNGTSARLDIGFRAVALTDPSQVMGGDTVSSFDEFCDSPIGDENSIQRFLSDDLCGECKERSEQFVVTCIVNVMLIGRNMVSDITRMYPQYDLNCPNFYGSLMATLSVILGLWTIASYQDHCFNDVEQDLRPFYRNNFTVVPDDPQDVDPSDLLLVRFEWRNGPGLNCLWASTCLRIVDALCNYLVPTPSITRNRRQQQDYECKYGPYHHSSSAADPCPTTTTTTKRSTTHETTTNDNDQDDDDHQHRDDPPKHVEEVVVVVEEEDPENQLVLEETDSFEVVRTTST